MIHFLLVAKGLFSGAFWLVLGRVIFPIVAGVSWKKTDEFIHTVCFVSVNCMGVKWRSDTRAMR